VSRPAVIDTNIVVSGILTARPESPTARILDGMMTGTFPYLISVALLAEYRQVLLRPKISRRHGLSAPEVDIILTEIAANGAIVDVEPATGRRKEGDDHLWQILDENPSAVLVTGDKQLFDRPKEGHRVLSPKAYLELIGA